MEFLKFLEGIRTPAATAFFRAFTWLGEELFIVGILCLIYWCISKKFAYRICFAYFASGLMVQILKITFRIPRPWILDDSFRPVESAVKTATGYSFPSGHTQAAVSLYGTFFLNVKGGKKQGNGNELKQISSLNQPGCPKNTDSISRAVCLRILSLCAIAAVGLSRMYLGVHTPKDVLTSLAVSFLLVYLANYLTDRGILERHKGITALVLVFISLVTAVYAFILQGSGIITTELVSDCVKAAGAGIGFAAGWYMESTWIQFENNCSSRAKLILRFVLGIAGTLLWKSGLKAIFGESLPVDAMRYAFTVLWITCMYPYLIRKCRLLH